MIANCYKKGGLPCRKTLAQAQFFTDYDLELPPTMAVAENLMRYVMFGNSLYRTAEQENETPEQRAGYVREAQKKWNGKHATRQATDGDGAPIEMKVVVRYLSARSREEIQAALERQRSHGAGFEVRIPDRFKAIIGPQGQFVGLEWLRDPE